MQRDTKLIRKILFKIEDTIVNKTKSTISDKGLPFVFDIEKSVSSVIITGIIKGTISI